MLLIQFIVQGWASFMIKRATILHLHHQRAMWLCTSTRRKLRAATHWITTTYKIFQIHNLCMVWWLNQHTLISCIPCSTATWLVSNLISTKGSHTSSFNDVTKLKNSGPTTQWTQTQQAWYSLLGSCSSCSGDLSGNPSWLISLLSTLDTWVCLWILWTDTQLFFFLNQVFCNSIHFFHFFIEIMCVPIPFIVEWFTSSWQKGVTNAESAPNITTVSVKRVIGNNRWPGLCLYDLPTSLKGRDVVVPSQLEPLTLDPPKGD